MGDVTLTWDEQQTSREELLAAMAKAGFREQLAGMDAGPGSFPTS
jgi:hypothetical protein